MSTTDRELQELILVIQDIESAEPDPEFARRLDARVADRFGRARKQRRRWPRLALAGAAAAVPLAIAVGGAISDLTREHSVTRPAIKSAEPSAPTAQADLSVAVSGARTRRIERSTELTLAAPDDRLEHVGTQIVQVADRHRGYVKHAFVSSGRGSTHSGSFELRVPTRELKAAVAELSTLAEVRSRTDTASDISRTFNSASQSLTTDLVERRGLLRQLSHATTTADADKLRSRLDRLSVDIQRLRGQLSGLRQRTNYTNVSVSLVAKSRGAATGPVHDAGRALRGSLHSLVAASAVVLQVAGALLPFAVLGALAWAAAGAVRRRRREAVLS